MRRFWLIIIFSFLTSILFAQEASDFSYLLDEIEGDEERTLMAELLDDLSAHPINLNEATAEELSQIPFFDDFFIRNFLLHRSRVGRIKSIYDLKEIQGAPLQWLPILEPLFYIDVDENRQIIPTQQQLFIGSEVLLPQYFSPHKNIGFGIRYEGKKGIHHRWGIVLGKDRGEKILPINKGVMDHISFTYRYEDSKNWHLTVGDYKVSSGLGLLMGQGLSYFSSAEASSSSPSISQNIIRPHISFREYNYLRGLAFATQINQVDLHFFYGIENIDARMSKGRISTIYQGGMHRTEKELRYRHSAQLRTLGSNIAYSSEKLQIGITSIFQKFFHQYRTPLLPPNDLILKNSSLYFQYLTSQFKFFGETLLTYKDRIGAQIGFNYYHERLGNFTLIGRYLAPNHSSFYGNPDTYYSSGKNERGLQAIWKGEIAYWWSGVLYVDIFRKILKEKNTNTNLGYVINAKTYYGYGTTRFQGGIRYIKLPDKAPRITSRLSIHHTISKNWSIKGGANLIINKGQPLNWAVFSRLSYGSYEKLRAELGLQYFDLTNGIIRSDNPYMPHRYYAPMLRGKGIRTTAALRYPVSRKLQFQARSSLTFYSKLPTTPLSSILDISAIYKW